MSGRPTTPSRRPRPPAAARPAASRQGEDAASRAAPRSGGARPPAPTAARREGAGSDRSDRGRPGGKGRAGTGRSGEGRTGTAPAPSGRPGGRQRGPAGAGPRQVVSTTSVRRFAARSRAVRRMTWRTVARVVVVLLLVVAVVWVVRDSPLLVVRSVEVTGTQRLAPEQVTALADPERDVPLARVDTGAVADRVRAALPLVLDVSVHRDWPSGLVVEVRERVPLAVVPAADGRFDVVDGYGVVVDRPEQAPEGMPLVHVDAGEAGWPAVAEAAAVMRALPEDLRARVLTVSALTRDSVTLSLDGGAEVFWGNADRSDRKAQVLQVLVQVPASVYDVSAPDTPVTR